MIARLVRLLGDVDTAKEIAQDAFVIAIEKWRVKGGPSNPAAWLHQDRDARELLHRLTDAGLRQSERDRRAP